MEKQFTIYTFDADHAFANPSNPKFDKEASQQAEQHTLTFLKQKLVLE
ncbi:MAG: hypothetical protein EOP56_09755 [Sphingobacteriales bacterium]|nr:MAG: hypothetical protein EOP56_09755 [Sphingobacteriales bacterium]